MTSSPQSLQPFRKNEKVPEWLPIQFADNYEKTDLTYKFCLKIFGQLQAAKRENFPPETMRQWFIEFIKRGWNKAMVQKRYDALLGTKIFGVDKLDIADWVNAVSVYGEDEMNVLLDRRIENMINKGRMLKNQKIELTELEKKSIELALAKEIQLELNNQRYEAMENYKNELREIYYKSLNKKKQLILDMNLEKKVKLLDKLYELGIIKGEAKGFEYQTFLHHLELYADLIPNNLLGGYLK